MEFIKPIAITDAILTGSNVPENDYAEWVARNISFVSLGQSARQWRGMAAAPNGNVYASVSGGDIYMQTGGSGAFAALGQSTLSWFGMAAAPNGNVYACVVNGDIYMQTGGSGAFAALGQSALQWVGMCAAPNGNVYASVHGGDIYMQTGGSGAFVALGQTARSWFGMAAAPNGNVYACVDGGDIYMQTGGSGAFAALGQSARSWYGMCAAPNGNVYACDYNHDIYMQTNGSGNFVALGQSARNWTGMAAAPNGNVYANDYNGGIYMQSSAGLYFTDDYVIVTTPDIHNIYQSLTDNNANNYPVNDSVNWLKIGSTNRWKTFNAIIGSQTEQATKIEYILTPGEAIDSVALLNIDSDTVEITEIDTTEALLNETAWTGATGTTQSTGWNKVGTPSDYTIDGGMIRITADAASEGQSKTVAVTPGVEYQLLGLYKNNSGDTAQYGIYDNTHSSDILATTDLPSSTTNASFSYVFTAPAGCISIEIKQMAKANTDVVWFDSFILAPTKYSAAVTTGSSKIDVVKLDIPEISTGILTVVINKTPNVNVYASVYGGDIYMQTAGSGAFVALGQSARDWRGMAAAPNGNVYACVYNGDIYKQTGGSGAFVALGQTTRNWRGMCAAPNGNVYACVNGGDIYMQTNGSGNFVALGQTTRDWFGMCAAPNGNVYASVYNGGDIYMQTGGSGAFVALGQSARDWRDMAAAPNGNVYACVYNGDIYKQTGGSGNFVALNQTVRNWRGMAATPNGNVYACDNLGDVYMQTGGSGDFVALGQSAREWVGMAAALERAAIGELIIGKSTYIGDLQYAPSFGIKDWSTITTDVWGNRIIVPRAFSKWLKCPVCVLSTNMDEINRLMSLYRGVNLLWIANPDYSAMIVYGIYTDYSQTWQHLDFTICNLEIEGLT